MFKLQSIITHNKLKKYNEFTLNIESPGFHYIYSENKNLIDEIFLITHGLSKPKLGDVIYDTLNILSLNLNKRSSFIAENIGSILPVNLQERKMTVAKLIETYLTYNEVNKKELKSKIQIKANEFAINELLEEKVFNLTNSELVKIYVLLSTIKKKKYILIKDLEKYLFSHVEFSEFLTLLKQHHGEETFFVFYSNQKLSFDASYFNIVDLEEVDTVSNKTMLVCDQNFFPKNKKNIFKYFMFFELIFRLNLWSLLFFFLFNAVIITFLGITNTLILIDRPDVLDPFVFLNTSLTNLNAISYIALISLFIFDIVFVFYFLEKNSWVLVRLSHSGQNVISVLAVYVLVIGLTYSTAFLLSLIFPLYALGVNSSVDVNWFFITFFSLLVALISIILFIILFVYRYQKLLKKNDEIL